MELTLWQSFVVFIWGEFIPTKYLAYHKRLKQGMAKRPAYKFASKSNKKQIDEFLKLVSNG